MALNGPCTEFAKSQHIVDQAFWKEQFIFHLNSIAIKFYYVILSEMQTYHWFSSNWLSSTPLIQTKLRVHIWNTPPGSSRLGEAANQNHIGISMPISRQNLPVQLTLWNSSPARASSVPVAEWRVEFAICGRYCRTPACPSQTLWGGISALHLPSHDPFVWQNR